MNLYFALWWVIKNRVCKAAMTERIAKGNNSHQGHANLYERWADKI